MNEKEKYNFIENNYYAFNSENDINRTNNEENI